MNKKLFIIILIVIAISMIVTCSPYPATDYRILTVKSTDLASTENPKPYDLTTFTYNEGDHLYFRTSETKDQDEVMQSSIEQTLNENKFPTKQVITNYTEGLEEETKQFIDFVYDETNFLPTSIIRYEGLNDTSKTKTDENTYTFDDKGLFLSANVINYAEDGTTKESEFVIKNLIPKNTKKIHERMLTNIASSGGVLVYMGILLPASQKNYDDGDLSYETVINFDGDGYPTTMVETDHTETPPVSTTTYFRVTLNGKNISLIELFEDSAYTTPVSSGGKPSKLEYTYDGDDIISQIDIYYYMNVGSESLHLLMQRSEYDWVGYPVTTRNGNMPAFTISTLNVGAWITAYNQNPDPLPPFQDYLVEQGQISGEWTTDLILVMTVSEAEEQVRALEGLEETTITFEVVDVK